jgi:hypothetical protein
VLECVAQRQRTLHQTIVTLTFFEGNNLRDDFLAESRTHHFQLCGHERRLPHVGAHEIGARCVEGSLPRADFITCESLLTPRTVLVTLHESWNPNGFA